MKLFRAKKHVVMNRELDIFFKMFQFNTLVLLLFNSKKGLGTPGFKKLFEISLFSLSFFNIMSMG